ANARWSNGDPVTARDFVFSVRRILSPRLGSPFRYYLDDVRGAQEYAASAHPDFAKVGVRALDDRTLQIELKHPAPYFLFLLGNWAWYPLHRPTIEKFGRYDEPGTPWTKPGNFVGNGPFVLEQWRAGQFVVVRRNPHYWDAAHVRLNAIYFHFDENLDSEERSFRSGQLHITEGVPVSKLRDYARQQPSPLVIADNFTTYGYAFNVKLPPFQDPRVRQAFSLAIDRDRVVASQTGSGIRTATSFTPPVGRYRYAGPAGARFDPAEARRLLAEAGYPDGRGFPTVEIATNLGARHQEIAEVIQQMWRQNLGVEVGIRPIEAKVYFSDRIGGRLPLHRLAWSGDFLDPFAFLSVFLTGGGQNSASYANPEYDRLLLAAVGTLDEDTRLARYQAAETRLLRDAPYIPLFHDPTRHLVHPAVRGRYPNLLDFHPYQGMWLQGP
ncbi:MAG: peptide ABC transporter substrate-binding protein, partial [Verrucomicrobia bacterium]|nr:peptide ABC transporter substrate-binding protein [Verrucomicrobiota bacterium]